ncbi:MAG: DUF1992 domain-containing protein [Anaerolineales bacterium]
MTPIKAGPDRRRAIPAWEPRVERIIWEAQESGAFDHLPGKGKPLHLEQDPMTPRAWQLAYHVLQNAGYKPDWIEKRKSIELDLESARDAYHRSRSLAHTGAARQAAADRFRRELESINKRVDVLNLEVPHPAFQMHRLRLDHELARVGDEP